MIQRGSEILPERNVSAGVIGREQQRKHVDQPEGAGSPHTNSGHKRQPNRQLPESNEERDGRRMRQRSSNLPEQRHFDSQRCRAIAWTAVIVRLIVMNLRRAWQRLSQNVQRTLSVISLTHKPVSYAVRREEVRGILWISFQFLPELQDVVVDCPPEKDSRGSLRLPLRVHRARRPA